MKTRAKKEKKIQSRSWQLIIPTGWDNLEAIKERCKSICRNFYFIQHDHDTNELNEPVKPHWHLLLSFATSRELSTMQNYFKEYGKFDKEEPKENEEKEPAQEENQQLLMPNSFERVYCIKGARRYLVHADDPQKHQYSPASVETNDPLFLDSFLPSVDKINQTKSVIKNFQSLGQCETFTEFLLLFEEQMYKMSVYQQANLTISLRRYYNEYKSEYRINRDGFEPVIPPYDPYAEKPNYKINLDDEPLPF
ncbi:MAG: replication protein [Fibromonadaceae bacterium]|jgi:hypothetical protein|nr:replication protein [Fibromonadaceae bacterium]